MYFKVIVLALLGSLVSFAACDPQQYSERDLMQMINLLDKEQSLHLIGGLSLEKTKSARSYFIDENEDTVERVSRYLDTHELKYNWAGDETAPDSDVGESRTRKLKKIVLPLILALGMKFSLIVPIILKVLTLVSLKGLAAGLLALMFSGASLVKDLFSKKREQVTTAYITGAAPLAAEIVQQDWNRNGQAAAQEMAYNYHTLPQQF